MLLMVGAARASPYWIAYEGNDYPENEGRTRYATDPPAQRWLQDGSLFVDSRGQPGVTDAYVMSPAGGVDPDPGETFVMTWRLNVHEATPAEDPGVTVTSDDRYAVVFLLAEDQLLSVYEPGVSVQLQPGVFHDFELCSPDMRSYALSIDGHLTIEGEFSESPFAAGVWWGDLMLQRSSLASWDYFRFGVIPEPSTLVLTLACALLQRRKEA
jgi:hypothetical protein